MPRVALGVYADDHRVTTLAFKTEGDKVWHLGIVEGSGDTIHVEVEVCGSERFLRRFVIHYEDYPLLKAIRQYKDMGIVKTPLADKVLRAMFNHLSGT